MRLAGGDAHATHGGVDVRRGTDYYQFDGSETIQSELINMARFALSWFGGDCCTGEYDTCAETDDRSDVFHHNPRFRGGDHGLCCVPMRIKFRWSGSNVHPHYMTGGKAGPLDSRPLHNRDDQAGSQAARKTWRGINMHAPHSLIRWCCQVVPSRRLRVTALHGWDGPPARQIALRQPGSRARRPRHPRRVLVGHGAGHVRADVQAELGRERQGLGQVPLMGPAPGRRDRGGAYPGARGNQTVLEQEARDKTETRFAFGSPSRMRAHWSCSPARTQPP